MRRSAPTIPSAALVLALLAPHAVQAQQPTGPPPPSGAGGHRGPEYHELLPDIGRIGAEAAAFAGGSWNPYEAGRGVLAGGYVDLPLRRVPGGKLSYELFLALSLATSDPYTVTLPSRRAVRTRLRLLQASPFALKYVLTVWDAAHVRPYVAAGVDVLVASTEQDPPPVGSPEAAARGLPTGRSRMDVGGHAAGGIEIRLGSGISLNVEYRFTMMEGSRRLHAATSALGFHW